MSKPAPTAPYATLSAANVGSTPQSQAPLQHLKAPYPFDCDTGTTPPPPPPRRASGKLTPAHLSTGETAAGLPSTLSQAPFGRDDQADDTSAVEHVDRSYTPAHSCPFGRDDNIGVVSEPPGSAYYPYAGCVLFPQPSLSLSLSLFLS